MQCVAAACFTTFVCYHPVTIECTFQETGPFALRYLRTASSAGTVLRMVSVENRSSIKGHTVFAVCLELSYLITIKHYLVDHRTLWTAPINNVRCLSESVFPSLSRSGRGPVNGRKHILHPPTITSTLPRHSSYPLNQTRPPPMRRAHAPFQRPTFP